MCGTHLKQKGRWWHYYRSVLREFADVERKPLISFSLKTGHFTEAKRMAAEITARVEQDWRDAKPPAVVYWLEKDDTQPGQQEQRVA